MNRSMKIWITRSVANTLYLHLFEPTLIVGGGYWECSIDIPMPKFLFQEVTFENSPKRVKIELI